VSVKVQLTVHRKDSCAHQKFHWTARIVILSPNTQKSAILMNFL